MTLNDSWGYQKADDNWKSAKTVIRNLISCSRDGGNYLLNIGPKAEGSIPQESIDVLTKVGHWMQISGDTIYGSDICQPRRANYASFTQKANTLYMHVHFWPGEDVEIGGLRNKVLSARVLKTGRNIALTQDGFCTKFTGLPMNAPDDPVTTIAIETASRGGTSSMCERTSRAERCRWQQQKDYSGFALALHRTEITEWLFLRERITVDDCRGQCQRRSRALA